MKTRQPTATALKYGQALAAGMHSPAVQAKANELGISPRRLERAAHRLEKSGSVSFPPRASKPRKYTPRVLDAVTAHLRENKHKIYSLAGLVAELKHLGKLHPGAKTSRFGHAYGQHLAEHGMTLRTRDKRTKFHITPKRAQERLAFAHMMLNTAKRVGAAMWKMLVFTDETTYEEEPHPKAGALAQHRCHACMPALCVLLHTQPHSPQSQSPPTPLTFRPCVHSMHVQARSTLPRMSSSRA
jgi:hypothetical protein